MNDEIHFGDMSQRKPECGVRPDRHPGLAVEPVGEPAEEDLAVYIDLDVLREMWQHAASDMHVELGGVLLGGQFYDEDERPFVVIQESLRATHYENSRGSFKFTHDTWREITRRSDDYPDDIRIVGWYHTHPDWGVFLSSQDEFICRNFFPRPSDIALVIDPCRSDIGFFYWSDDRRQLRQCQGFYLTASRLRRTEVEQSARLLEKGPAMTDTRSFGTPPVVHIRESLSPWLAGTLAASLVIQCSLLALIAWHLVTGGPDMPRNASTVAEESGELDSQSVDVRAVALQAKIDVLEQLLAQWDETPPNVVDDLVARTAEVQELRASLRAHLALEQDLDRQLAALREELAAARQQNQQLLADLAAARQSEAEARPLVREEQGEDTAETGDPLALSTPMGMTFGAWIWLAVALGAVLIAAAAGLTAAVRQRQTHARSGTEPSGEARQEPMA